MNRRYILPGIIVAIIAGFLFGGFLPVAAKSSALLGEILLNLLMMVVVPLVLLSIISGITSLGNIRSLGKTGRRTIIYYIATTGISVLAGIILVNIIQPGRGISTGERHDRMEYRISGDEVNTLHITGGKLGKTGYSRNYRVLLLDQDIMGSIKTVSGTSITVTGWEERDPAQRFHVVREDGQRKSFTLQQGSLVPVESRLRHSGTGVAVSLPPPSEISRGKQGDVSEILKEVLIGNPEEGREGLIPRNIFNAMIRMDFLGLIFFAIVFGIALSVLGEKNKTAVEVIAVLNDAVHRLVEWIMYIVPIGIFGIISSRIGAAGGFSGFLPELIALAKYVFTVLLGLSFHGLIVLPLLLYLFIRKNPFTYMARMLPALLNAFSTASSSATLPLTMEAVEKENGVSEKVSSFVLPIGATINMDGTALYEAVAALFIAQVYGIELGASAQTVIFLTATLAAIGAAGIPEAGLITMVIVLKAVGLPVEGIGLLLTIDWLLDRFRTTVNVWGDSVGAGIIDSLDRQHP